ncbi:MAG: HTTM domain-containing protein [Labilithrix sp.]|nr:HTTM domain-containing protein [Labilithrix sp.]
MKPSAHRFVGDMFLAWLDAPVPFLRLELVRIGAPLAILGFMSSRVAHADEWLGDAGFRVPDLGRSDYRQPLYLASLSSTTAWIVAGVLVASGLAVAIGWKPRWAAGIFAIVTAYVALSDRLAAFSVSKMAPVVAIALAASPCGARWSVDAWLARRRDPRVKLPKTITSGSVRFFQLLLPTIYCASGIAKAKGDWLKHSHVLWTHLHDTYQTSVTVALANLLPAPAWTLLQAFTLIFETFAPIWFLWKRSRTAAFLWAISMHAMIGLMFGPVRWFALLMATLLAGAYMPEPWLTKLRKAIRRRAVRHSRHVA